MRWKGRETSSNIEDRRGARGMGGGMGGRAGVGGLGLVAIVLIGMFLGVDVTPFLSGGGTSVIASMIAVGVIVNVGVNSKAINF